MVIIENFSNVESQSFSKKNSNLVICWFCVYQSVLFQKKHTFVQNFAQNFSTFSNFVRPLCSFVQQTISTNLYDREDFECDGGEGPPEGGEGGGGGAGQGPPPEVPTTTESPSTVMDNYEYEEGWVRKTCIFYNYVRVSWSPWSILSISFSSLKFRKKQCFWRYIIMIISIVQSEKRPKIKQPTPMLFYLLYLITKTVITATF